MGFSLFAGLGSWTRCCWKSSLNKKHESDMCQLSGATWSRGAGTVKAKEEHVGEGRECSKKQSWEQHLHKCEDQSSSQNPQRCQVGVTAPPVIPAFGRQKMEPYQ